MPRPSTGLLTTAGKERVFPLRGRLTRQLSGCCIARLLVFATEGRGKPMLLRIDSTGGPITHALDIISTMNGIRTPIATFLGPVVEGASVVIGSHGLRGFRVAPSGARLSFKSLAQEISNSPEEAQILPLLAEVLANDTQKAMEEVSKWLRRGVEFNARQALEVGLIDHVSATPLWPPAG